jgi:hypothetical protein
MWKRAKDLKKGDVIVHPLEPREAVVQGTAVAEGWAIVITEEGDPRETMDGHAFSCLAEQAIEVRDGQEG